MCGIAGILGPQRDPAGREPIVRVMAQLLRHRGPDDEGLYSSPQAVLGHRRLAIIDLEHNKQPMLTADGRYALVFNGEIYNYLELRQQLIQHGESFHTFSDTEVLLKLLVAEGTSGLNKLLGMYAFTFVDRNTGEWLMARDPFGIKPLYYAQTQEEIIFASEIKALFSHPRLAPKSNWDGLQEYFTFQLCLGEKTMFESVFKVEPGMYMRGRGGQITEKKRFWDMPFEIDEHHTESYFIERLKSLLEDSARLQIRSDVPLGAYLSGGLDSTVVSMLAADVLKTPLKVFHGRFAEGPAYDESGYARAVAEPNGFELFTTTPTADQFCEDLPMLMRMLDEPVAGPGLFPQYRVSLLAREQVKVVLGGQGGDELFCGYARYLLGYLEQALKGSITETQEEGKHIVTLASIVPNLPLLEPYKPLMQHFWSRGLFGDMDQRYFWLINRGPDMLSLLSGDARNLWDHDRIFSEFQSVFNRPGTNSYINKMQYFDMHTLLPALLQVEDRVSMAVGLESRVPLLDPRIAELVGSVTPSLKFQGGRTKHLFKNAMHTVVPPAILNRKDKMGFPVPLKEWTQKGKVREFVRDTLTSKAARERGLFDPSAVDKLFGHDVTFGRQLWGILCLELWHQQMIDSRNTVPA